MKTGEMVRGGVKCAEHFGHDELSGSQHVVDFYVPNNRAIFRGWSFVDDRRRFALNNIKATHQHRYAG